MYCNQLLFVVTRIVGGWLFVVISFNSISFLVDLKVKTTRNQFIFFKHPFSLFVWRFFLGFCQGQCAMPKIRLIIFCLLAQAFKQTTSWNIISQIHIQFLFRVFSLFLYTSVEITAFCLPQFGGDVSLLWAIFSVLLNFSAESLYGF